MMQDSRGTQFHVAAWLVWLVCGMLAALFTRNPLYLSMTLIYGGITARANALPAALLLPLVLNLMRRGVIEREERYLERKFGEEYLGYKARVGRWI